MNKWKDYFNRRAQIHGSSVKSSDYFDDASFFMQRDNILNWLGRLKDRQILDAGCGVGAFSEPLTKDNTVYGVDFSEKSLEFAAQRGLKTVAGDLSALNFANGKFDVVLCIGVIQLIEQHAKAVEELARVTKPGGMLLLQTLHKNSVQRKILSLFEKNKKFDKMYAMRELTDIFTGLGFERIEFLKMYHPFKFANSAGGENLLTDIFCTSFAVKGIKKDGTAL